ncbi:hypothetical protein IQ255_15310 [Pleurocapsales cyanobacterium LEGE 10410]|nr:hypothetical protein [Pleurocapsales cyanobacterium LEGE 10410]
MALYSNTLASHSYRFKRLMLTYTDTEIEQTLRNARLLFEKLDKILDSPTEATETYRLNIEKLVDSYKMDDDLTLLQAEIELQYAELNKLLEKNN